eukprot:gene5672-6551_t
MISFRAVSRGCSSLVASSRAIGVTRSFASSCCGGGSPKLPTAPEHIELDDFFKVDLRIAKVLKADHVEGAKKLIKLTLDLGPKRKTVAPAAATEAVSTPEPTTTTTETTTTTTEVVEERDIRTVFSGIKAHYEPEKLEGKNVIVVANLKPRKLKFGMSEGMVLFASDEDSKSVLYTTVDDGALPGMKVL